VNNIYNFTINKNNLNKYKYSKEFKYRQYDIDDEKENLHHPYRYVDEEDEILKDIRG
jgi:hypothetical protein